MTVRPSQSQFETEKFGIGQPVSRKEDPVLIQGQGRYTDDLQVPGQVYMAMVRSPVAHGIINAIDTAAAQDMPGVLGVWTGADLNEAGLGAMKMKVLFPNRDGSPLHETQRRALATDKVRFVGDPVAFVVAQTAVQAKDAAEAVGLDIDALPAVTDMAAAVLPDAPQLYDHIPNNTVLDYHSGDTAAVTAAFAKAAHVARLSLDNTRLIVNPMEVRAAIADYDPARDHYTFHVGSQGVFGLRAQIATDILGVKPEQVTVLTGHVGGSFGMKIAVFPEYICLLHAARHLGRPVKWTEDRSASFMSDQHGRAHRYDAELALDSDGRFLAVRIHGFGDLGAYSATVGVLPPTRNIVVNTCSQYDLPLIEVAMRCVVTNTSSVGAYRGAGRPEGNYIMERLIDTAAAEMGLDRIAMRRRNQIKPGQLPYKAASGMTYDTGDFTAQMDEALAKADAAGFPARRQAAAAQGKLLGLGIGCFLEATAAATVEMGGLRFEKDGTVTMITGTLDFGQGHNTTLSQIVSARLGVPFDKIRLIQGDSNELIHGGGTGGSKSIIASGSALVSASDRVIEAGKGWAAHILEAGVNDIEFSRGRFAIAGTDRSIDVIDLAARVRAAPAVPDGLPATLDVKLINEGPGVTFPNGCHVCEVEIDESTGATRIVKYTSVNDFGTVINPLLVEGQLHGGVVQGIGQCLMEHTVYDEDGQLITGSFMDYAMPRADDAPMIGVHHHPVPTTENPLGVKGCGEAGCAGSMTSIMNAVVDALSVRGIRAFDMPATPARVWRALQDANAAQH
ncbi:MAG: xanthine dehydrogenase family protein molybdopterin-binding subunit [Beijerinckiaceae bacterium]